MKEEDTQKVNTFAAMNKRLDDMHGSMEQTFLSASKRFDVLYDDLDDFESSLNEEYTQFKSHVNTVLLEHKKTINNQADALANVNVSLALYKTLTKVSMSVVIAELLVGIGFLIGGKL